MLTVLGEGGDELVPRAVVHTDPVVGAAMRAVLGAENVHVGEGVAGMVAADHRSVVLNDLEPTVVAETTPERFLPFVRDHPMRAMMIVPMVAAGELVGTLGAIRTSTVAPYEQTDLRLLEALASRAALVIADAATGPRAVGPADFEAVYRFSVDGILITTPDGHILASNPAACTLLRATERAILDAGRDAGVVAGAHRVDAFLAERARIGHARAELTLRRGDGTTFPADVTSAVFTSPEGQVRTVVVFRDVSREAAEREASRARVAELEHAADRDPLTGMLNRRGFTVAADQALATADPRSESSFVVFVDLDGLKRINDTRRHPAGDAAIVAASTAIDRSLRALDVSCRLGGDELVVLVVGATADDLPAVVDRMGRELAAEPGAPEELTFSTGWVERSPGSTATLDDLVEAADRDMYQRRLLRRLRGSP